MHQEQYLLSLYAMFIFLLLVLFKLFWRCFRLENGLENVLCMFTHLCLQIYVSRETIICLFHCSKMLTIQIFHCSPKFKQYVSYLFQKKRLRTDPQSYWIFKTMNGYYRVKQNKKAWSPYRLTDTEKQRLHELAVSGNDYVATHSRQIYF